MIANARSFALAFVGLPAVVGFGVVPSVDVEAEGDYNFQPDLTYLEDSGYFPCSLLGTDNKEVNVFQTGWCGKFKTKEECGDPLANETLPNMRLGKSKLTTKYGLSTNYDICAWDKDKGTAGKCRLARWSYTCPEAYCDGVAVRPRSDPTTIFSSNPCKTNTIASKLHFKKETTPYFDPEFGGTLQYYSPATFYFNKTCEHKLIDTAGRRRLEAIEADKKTPAPRRRLNHGDCPVSLDMIKHDMADGGVCCDNSAPGAAAVSLVTPFKTTADGSFVIEYLETCKYEGGSTCTCSYEAQSFALGGCPPITPTRWTI